MAAISRAWRAPANAGSVAVAQGFATPAKAGPTVCSVPAVVVRRIDLVQ